MAKFRKKMSKRRSKKSFTKGALRVQSANFYNPMRGGIRM